MAYGFVTDHSSDYPWIEKDPEAVLDYTMDWSAWLGADTISGTPAWTVPAGLTKASQANTTTSATAWISGGTAGQTYQVSCLITTAGGRTDTRTFEIRVVAR